jgi:trans-aconitate methyltransferase
MGYFDEKKNVEEYIKESEEYNGSELIGILKKYLQADSSVLELGMGPGKDIELLSRNFHVTGSDYSQVFIDIYKKKNKNADILLLDAVKMNTDRKFDCIYSNKVLHHLCQEDLRSSLNRQLSILNSKGILFHSLWYGDKEEEYSGLRFVYYTEKTILKIIGFDFDVLEIQSYSEMEKDDSMYIILRKKF